MAKSTAEKDFFKIQTSSSRIKAKIVAEYFPRYCRIILKKQQKEIRYLDLFAGPGMYEDGNHSTPLLLAKSCAEDSNLVQKVHLMFNDNEFADQLKHNFLNCFPSGTFKFEPRFGNKTVGEDDDLKKYLMKDLPSPNPHPTLLFFDPWGYKGIDTLVLAKFLRGWGNEIFLFVNIKRIHAAIENGKFDELMQALFPTSIDQIKTDRKYKAINVHERLVLIMDNLANEFKKAVNGTLHHCSFKFQEEDSAATSHFIIHFTKHSKGYELVKQIYYDFDNIGATLEKEDTYTFDAKKMDSSIHTGLDFGDQNVAALSKQLLDKYKGRAITAKALFDEHQVCTSWCGTHYAKTLRDMAEKGSVRATFTDGKEHIVSVLLTDHCKLEFN
jgi:three-Cys-motif partner protein